VAGVTLATAIPIIITMQDANVINAIRGCLKIAALIMQVPLRNY